jgi:hypothetical protein
VGLEAAPIGSRAETAMDRSCQITATSQRRQERE